LVAQHLACQLTVARRRLGHVDCGAAGYGLKRNFSET
jgi:hypothetical protein